VRRGMGKRSASPTLIFPLQRRGRREKGNPPPGKGRE